MTRMQQVLRPTPPLALLHLRRDDFDAARDGLASLDGDALLVEWGEGLEGLYDALAAAASARRVLFPARWLAADLGPGAEEAQLLWVARGELALRRLFGEADPGCGQGMPRPDEPLCLLGVPGDALQLPLPAEGEELRRRAEAWLQRLGPDRVAVVIPDDAPDHPLARLATERGLPRLSLHRAGEAPSREEAPSPMSPLLDTQFQLDGEHRLPDDAWVPALRDLLARGSLLRERALFDRLPDAWREQAAEELKALHAWHVSPLLRRAGALVQTVQPVPGVELEPLLPSARGVVAWLLGLGGERPVPAGGPSGREAAVEAARTLAAAVHEWDRRVALRVPVGQWNRLRNRLLPWADGGHLALCDDAPDASTRRYCFSGQPLWARVPLQGEADGLPRMPLARRDRRALGWFELEISVAELQRRGPEAPVLATVASFPTTSRAATGGQLPLGFDRAGND